MANNNENSFVSQLRPPTRILSPDKLGEMSASANNARMSTMPPPANTLKRKTLAEKGGETLRPAPVPPASRQLGLKGTTIAAVVRENSFSSSVSSSRPTSSASVRHPSNSSFSSSMGPGSRAPSSQSYRPHTAMGGSRIQKLPSTSTRPTSALDSQRGEGDLSRMVGKRKGRAHFPSYPMDYDPSLKSNGYCDARVISSSDRESIPLIPRSLRDVSLIAAMNGLHLNDEKSKQAPKALPDNRGSPSRIPKSAAVPSFPDGALSPKKSPQKTPKPLKQFLNRGSNTEIAFDIEDRLEDMEKMCFKFREEIDGATSHSDGLKEMVSIYKARINELESIKTSLQSSNSSLQSELDTAKASLTASSNALEDSKRYHSIKIDDLQRQHGRDLDEIHSEAEGSVRQLERHHTEEIEDMKRRLETALEDERRLREKEIQALSTEGVVSQQKAERELENQEKILQGLRDEVETAKTDIQHERDVAADLRRKLSDAASNAVSLEGSMSTLRAHIIFLESDNKSQSQAFADLEARMQNAIRIAAEANEKLQKEETLRRKLHNQVQELKGNIRVFCRVRPSLESDPTDNAARITFPDNESDSKEVEVIGAEEKSSLGNITTRTNSFAFDRVFNPGANNNDVFEEISQLVQSALDGYNVCIFCYGQTGSGKTYTMSSEDGMIPQAVHQIYDNAKSLEEKGWKYSMEGSFVEVYNETLNDLLGKAEEFDKKKHEIRHDMQKFKTTITDVTTVELDSPDRVESILRRASANRSVAATKANERSSRSHTVFILKLIGHNSTTGERSEGTLNLVDLAGSERLSHSKATGDRLKETQNINKSLSCLGDVIGALGQGKEGGHIPYRNSKLTYLLQFSLGGNSKTLMFVMISPLQAHLSETLTSLKFATKVHNTHIGTAKRQAKA